MFYLTKKISHFTFYLFIYFGLCVYYIDLDKMLETSQELYNKNEENIEEKECMTMDELIKRKNANKRLRLDCISVLGHQQFNQIYTYMKDLSNDELSLNSPNIPQCNVNILGKIQLLLAEEDRIESCKNEIFV